MSHTDEILRRDLDRLLTFVDAIVAIAITLLILPLAELPGELGDRPVADLLREHGWQFGAFALSFTVIARLWSSQHSRLRAVVTSPPGLYPLVMTWTATIVFLPFPTALLPSAGSQWLTKVLYIGTITLNIALVAGIALLIRRHPQCTGGGPLPELGSPIANVVLLLVALGLALALPGDSYYTLALLAVDGQALALWRRIRRGRAGA